MKTPTTLIIMDGFGFEDASKGNAVANTPTPNLDKLFAECPGCQLSASGLDVGLPDGQMGNSEVGHTNIGGGRVVFQDLPRISRAIDDGSFFANPAYNKAMDDCLKNGSSLHLYGLLSDGGVHSHIEHLFALLKMAKDKGLEKVYIHAFLDGRDVSPTSGKDFVAQCVAKCEEIGVGKIATVMGRFYAMDRDKRWERLQLAYDAMVYGEGIQNEDPVAAVAQSYQNGVTDEFVEPVVCDSEGTISDNDSVIFFNYRPDRAREITRSIVDPDFDGFQREFFPTTYVCNTEYDASMPNVIVAWPRIKVENGKTTLYASLIEGEDEGFGGSDIGSDRDIMDINFGGLFNLTKAVIPQMVSNKSGVILAVSSMWGQTGASCEALYSASKGAVDSYIKALAKELGPSGIRVNAVSPGCIDTDMMSCYSAEDKSALCEETPLGKLGTPSEVAEVLYFLQSDKASFITGQIIGVNGGFLI